MSLSFKKYYLFQSRKSEMEYLSRSMSSTVWECVRRRSSEGREDTQCFAEGNKVSKRRGAREVYEDKGSEESRQSIGGSSFWPRTFNPLFTRGVMVPDQSSIRQWWKKRERVLNIRSKI